MTPRLICARGCLRYRQPWIEERQDTELLAGASSTYGQARQQDVKTAHLRFEHIRQPRRALTDRNVTQLHYARQGIITPEMEYIAIRENMARAQLKEACQPSQQHLGEAFGAQILMKSPRVCPR